MKIHRLALFICHAHRPSGCSTMCMLATAISRDSCENSSLELDQPPSQDPRFRCFTLELLGAANCFVELDGLG